MWEIRPKALRKVKCFTLLFTYLYQHTPNHHFQQMEQVTWDMYYVQTHAVPQCTKRKYSKSTLPTQVPDPRGSRICPGWQRHEATGRLPSHKGMHMCWQPPFLWPHGWTTEGKDMEVKMNVTALIPTTPSFTTPCSCSTNQSENWKS